ncbi:NADH:flavin oxidoreductase/NADH oxidase [Salinadaptatus halalkaliphilus]|uniref:NADH:flavin oxidoreductase/NADH oxidase n=1 Tax=Salinadaptatus halalkaliphilus TaxID=2419781 RepID=A0A4S3TJR8_9EURY|nr:NADH:flavin oxidoreductase/NADH oxidase [Salinadaptatus halalkaliphilus]THE64236.1 NADH:flavin oxidoreductase/NADH oxidase [Salinadaptatus halalkaliphilus]
MPALFDGLSMRDCEIPNRIAVSPMCQYSCDRDGLPTEWHRVHLGSRAVGGAGIVLTEATAVEPRGRITGADLGIWSDEHAAALEPITDFVREQGAVPGIQLAHAGHKASKCPPSEGNLPLSPADGGWETLSPSPDAYPPFRGDRPAMKRASTDDIVDVIGAFRTAAERSLEAGFDIAEIHAAHGYLLHEFLSPVTNRREDEYGGSFENRTRLLREVTEEVRAVWPADKPLFVRISGTDWLEDRPSWDLEQSVRLADDLAGLGVDLIDVSSGSVHPDQEPPGGPNFQVPLAEAIRDGADIAVGAVGGITEPEQADAIVRNGRGDLVLVGREFLQDPYFGLHAADRLEDESADRWPVQYRRAVR